MYFLAAFKTLGPDCKEKRVSFISFLGIKVGGARETQLLFQRLSFRVQRSSQSGSKEALNQGPKRLSIRVQRGSQSWYKRVPGKHSSFFRGSHSESKEALNQGPKRLSIGVQRGSQSGFKEALNQGPKRLSFGV